MKTGFLPCLLLATVACAPVYAQEEDDIDQYFSQIDTGKDNKISLDEMKTHAWSELPEDATERDKVIAWAPHVIDFLLADANDDHTVTREEFRGYIDAMQDDDKKVKFTAKDWEFYQKDYLDPYIELSLKAADKDGDKALSKEEFGTLSDADPEEFAEIDTNADGKLTGDEYKQVIKKYIAEFYDFDEGTPAEADEKTKERFNGFDADGDGNITVPEWKAAVATEETTTAVWWGMYLVHLVVDLDEDGNVNLKEFAKFANEQPKGIKPKLMPSDKKAFLDTVWTDTDTDKDGKLSRAEYIAIAPEGHAEVYEQEFNGMDKDESGDLSRAELWESFKQNLTDYEIVEEKEDAPEKPEGTENSADPMWDVYRKIGRNWTHKLSSNYAGMENVSHMKYEVIKVEKDHAVVTITMLDKDKQPIAGVKAREAKILFKTSEGGEEGEAVVKDLGEKEVEVAAGKFACKGTETTVETSAGKTVTTSWMHAKYPTLIVKSESKTDDGSSVTELVEFND